MTTAILAAAGRGARYGANRNKIFEPLRGRTVFEWSLQALADCPDIEFIVVVVNPADRAELADLCRDCAKPVRLCIGGSERHESVWNALAVVPENTRFVAVHDAARPLIEPTLISACVEAARVSGAALPATPVSDTIKRTGDGATTLETVERAPLRAVQTPQVFELELLTRAYSQGRAEKFPGTDDASFVERLGRPVTLVPGARSNLKITVREDLLIAEALLAERLGEHRVSEIRTGFGYDVHQLTLGRALILGGVDLEHPEGLGLDGHSDADVLLHAISDALLGALALGDIGHHFPNTDERYRGVSSLALLAHVARLVREQGWDIGNIDSMLIAERPRINPRVREMRENIAAALGCSVDQVSVKATTNERLGFEGREEGMAAHAVATVRR